MPSSGKITLSLWLTTLIVPSLLLAGNTPAGRSAAVSSPRQAKPQTACPVMGGPIDKSLFVDVKGKRIYLCCAACEEAVRTEPDRYIKKIEQRGETVADTPRQE